MERNGPMTRHVYVIAPTALAAGLIAAGRSEDLLDDLEEDP